VWDALGEAEEGREEGGGAPKAVCTLVGHTKDIIACLAPQSPDEKNLAVNAGGVTSMQYHELVTVANDDYPNAPQSYAGRDVTPLPGGVRLVTLHRPCWPSSIHQFRYIDFLTI
jgi:hypothetical protein